MDANVAGLRQMSVRVARAGLTNVLYVRSAVETLPPELAGVADRVTAILPWGSLLAAFARPVVPILQGVRALCQPNAVLTVVVGIDPERDRAESHRLELPDLTEAHFTGGLATGYVAAGFPISAVRAITGEQLGRWPSSWARRLAFNSQGRRVWEIEARAS